MRCLQTFLLLVVLLIPVASADAASMSGRIDVQIADSSGVHALPAGSGQKHCTCPKSGICSGQVFALEGRDGFICELQLAAVMRPVLSSAAQPNYIAELEPPPPRRDLC